MTRWIETHMVQSRPYDLGHDESGRTQYVFTFECQKVPSATDLEEIVAILEAANVGKYGKTIFTTSAASVPKLTPTSEIAAYLMVSDQGGWPPIKTHNQLGATYIRPSFKITVHSARSLAARAMAVAAYDALSRVVNQDVTPVVVQ